MQSIKRDLSIGLSASAFVFACALAWGSPFVAAGSDAATAQEPQQAQPQQTQPDQAQPQQQPDQAPTKTFTGTILKKGGNFVLRDVSGHVFRLDDPDSAQPYEGKSVKVIGQLDEQAMLIHVQSIEGTAA